MAKNSNGYDRDYYRDVRRYKTAGFKAVAAASCQLCGDEWANTHVGWNSEIFVCSTCSSKLSKWDREKEMERRKMDALCQVCYVEPAISLHDSSLLRCCCGCSAWLSEGEAEGASGGNQLRAIRGIQMKSWATSLKRGKAPCCTASRIRPPGRTFPVSRRSAES